MPWGPIVNLAIKIILMFLDKRSSSRDAKQKFLEFILHFDAHLPVKLNDQYRRQLNQVKSEVKQNEYRIKNLERMLDTYKKAYEASNGKV